MSGATGPRDAPAALPAVIVGSGWARHAGRALRDRSDVSLRAVVGRGSDRSMRLAGELGVRLTASVEDAMGSASAGIAVVAVDETHTPGLARSFIQRGWDVLCAHPVAKSATDVEELDVMARARGVLVGTDYTFVMVGAAQQARGIALARGPVLRMTIEHPGRLLPMALHLADLLAGPVTSVMASRLHPPELAEAVARCPAAFPPALLAEHASGCVTSIVSMPHAEPSIAFRCRMSLPSMRLDLDLPLGRLVSTSIRRSGVHVATLAEGRPSEDPFGVLMRELVDAFVVACRERGAPPSPLSDDARVRRVWAVLGEAARCGSRTRVPLIPVEAG